MDYNPLQPYYGGGVSGLAGPSAVKVRFDADPNGAPGWSGFFDWLSKAGPNHAALYNYLRVVLPNFVEDSQPYPEAGRHLGAYSRSLNVTPRVDFDGFGGIYSPGELIGGLGDTTDPTQSINWLTTPASQLISMNPPQAATEGVTTGASQPTTVSSSNIIDTIKAAVPAFLTISNDQKILNAQLDRAAKGLPPLNLSSYTANTGLQFGLNASTQNTVLMVAAGLGAIFLLSKVLGRR